MVPQGYDYKKSMFLDWWLAEGQFAYKPPSPEAVEAMNKTLQGIFFPPLERPSDERAMGGEHRRGDTV